MNSAMFWFCVHIARIVIFMCLCVYLIEWLTHWTSTFHWMNVFLFLGFNDDIEYIEKYTHLHQTVRYTQKSDTMRNSVCIFGISITSNDYDERHFALFIHLFSPLTPNRIYANYTQNTSSPIHWDRIYHDCLYTCLLCAYTIWWLCYAFVIL